MLIEIIRAIVQKIVQDKLILGLIIMCIVAVFFTGQHGDSGNKRLFSKQHGNQDYAEGEENPEGQQPAQQSTGGPQGHNAANLANAQTQTPPQSQGQNLLTQPQATQPTQAAALAEIKIYSDFVAWWLTKGMDYNPATADASHKEAAKWAQPAVTNAFSSVFWAEERMQAINAGSKSCSFQLIETKPLAINPDGTVVVKATGVLVVGDVGYPAQSEQLFLTFQVKKDNSGMRIVNFVAESAGIR